MYWAPGRLRSMSRCLIFKPRRQRAVSPAADSQARPQPPAESRARLLDPRLEVVGFMGRQRELAALLAWCEDDQAGRLPLVTGSGWVGKTPTGRLPAADRSSGTVSRLKPRPILSGVGASGTPGNRGRRTRTGTGVSSMKAARWIGLGRVECEDVPVPPVADGEILVRTVYASICGSDLHEVFFATPPPSMPAGHPGHESVGEVAESRCPGFAPGDCVLTVPHAADGRCLSEFQALPGSACVRLLMAQQLGTVVYALRRHPLDLVGRDAAVIGQGSAGAFFTFLLKRAGVARVLVSDKSPARLAYSRKVGADLTVDVGTGDAGTGDFRSAVLEATGGRGADVVVEAVGSRETFPLSVELAAPGATLVWFGLPEGTGNYPFSFPDFFRRGLTAYSNFGAQGEPGLESFRDAVRLIEDGAIDVSPLLSRLLPIERVDEAFRIAHDL